MTMQIRERSESGWVTTKLMPATLTEDVWATLINGRNRQEISAGWLKAGSSIYVTERECYHPFHTVDELGGARDYLYDEFGMLHQLTHDQRRAIQIR